MNRKWEQKQRDETDFTAKRIFDIMCILYWKGSERVNEESMGMTDLQFKSWLLQLIARLKNVQEEESTNEKDKRIGEIIEEFELTLKNS